MPNDNYRNLLRKAKHQRDLLYFNHPSALAVQEERGLEFPTKAGVQRSNSFPKMSKIFKSQSVFYFWPKV